MLLLYSAIVYSLICICGRRLRRFIESPLATFSYSDKRLGTQVGPEVGYYVTILPQLAGCRHHAWCTTGPLCPLSVGAECLV